MHLTVLSDNNGTCDLTGEWGLSILIEYEKHTILLDAGASDLFWDNAQKLGVDLADADCAVLSHGHWDHANGFVPFLARTRGIPLYMRRSAFDSYWSAEEDGSLKYIGIPQELAQYADRLVYPEGDCQLFDGVWLIPHRMPGREQIGLRERMFRRREGGLEPEPQRELLEDARQDADWLCRMVENLLSVTRIGEGRAARLHKQEEALEEVLGAAVLAFRKRNPAIEVSVSVPEEPLFVPMDPVLIQQVLQNLMDNAVIHGGGTTAIRVTARQAGGFALVCVEDNGRVGGCGSTREVFLAKALVGNVEHAEVARVVHHAHVHATTVGTLVIIGYLQAPVFNQWVARNIFKHCLILYLAHANDGRAIGGVWGLHLREGIGHVVNL